MYLKSKKTCSIILYNLSSFNIDKYIIIQNISITCIQKVLKKHLTGGYSDLFCDNLPPSPNALGFVVWSNKTYPYITMFNIEEYFRHISVWQIILF